MAWILCRVWTVRNVWMMWRRWDSGDCVVGRIVEMVQTVKEVANV